MMQFRNFHDMLIDQARITVQAQWSLDYTPYLLSSPECCHAACTKCRDFLLSASLHIPLETFDKNCHLCLNETLWGDRRPMWILLSISMTHLPINYDEIAIKEVHFFFVPANDSCALITEHAHICLADLSLDFVLMKICISLPVPKTAYTH